MAIETALCPECGSGKLEPLDGVTAADGISPCYECRDCGKRFAETELLKATLEDPMLDLSQEGAAQAVAFEVAKGYMELLYRKASSPIGLCAIEAGIISKNDTKNLARILKAACNGAYRATLEEADAIAKEYRDKRPQVAS